MRHVDWRARPEEEPPELQDTRPDEAAGLLALALEREQEWLGAEEIAQLLDCYGIPTPAWRPAADPAAAAAAASSSRRWPGWARSC